MATFVESIIEMLLGYNVGLRPEAWLLNLPRTKSEYIDGPIRKRKRIILIAGESRKTYHRPLHFEKSKSM